MDNVTLFAQRLRILWLAVTVGGALVLAVMGVLAATTPGAPLADHAESAFYLVALVSLGGLGLGLFLIRSMEARLLDAGSDAEAQQIVQTQGVSALAAVDATAVLSAVAAFLTGDLLVLAFGAPLFAFAWLTWPSDARVARWLALRGR